MTEVIHWTDYLRALGPTTVALIVAYIAFQQWRVARASFKEKLFDRRFELYDLTKDMLFSAQLRGDDFGEMSSEFSLKRRAALFLFNQETAKFLEQIHSDALYLQRIENRMRETEPGSERWDNDAKKEDEIRDRLTASDQNLDKIMEPFLALNDLETGSARPVIHRFGKKTRT